MPMTQPLPNQGSQTWYPYGTALDGTVREHATKLLALSPLSPAPTVGDVLLWDADTARFQPAVLPAPTVTAGSITSGRLGIDRLPLGGEVTVDYYKTVYGAANAWPATRPTALTDIVVTWRGPTDPGGIAVTGDVIDLVG